MMPALVVPAGGHDADDVVAPRVPVQGGPKRLPGQPVVVAGHEQRLDPEDAGGPCPPTSGPPR